MRTPAKETSASSREAEAQLRTFVAKFAPGNQRLIRGVRRELRARFPTATELVYDNYNFFVIGYSPDERPSHAVVSIAAAANGVSICFVNGKRLPDPKKLLHGNGKQTRFLKVDDPALLATRDVRALFDAAMRDADVAFAETGRGRLIIQSISAKQRPRR